jgi:hypothetical protein
LLIALPAAIALCHSGCVPWRAFSERGDLSMNSDLERLLDKPVSIEQIPKLTIHWKPELAESNDRYMVLMRCRKMTTEERQEFHDLMDLEMNKPLHPERSECIDDYRRFLPSTIEEQFHELIRLPFRPKIR